MIVTTTVSPPAAAPLGVELPLPAGLASTPATLAELLATVNDAREPPALQTSTLDAIPPADADIPSKTERPDPEPDEIFKAFAAEISPEEAERRSAATLQTREAWGESQGNIEVENIKSNWQNPIHLRIVRDAKQAIGLSPDAFVGNGSPNEAPLSIEVKKRLDQTLPAERQRVASLELTRALIADVAARLDAIRDSEERVVNFQPVTSDRAQEISSRGPTLVIGGTGLLRGEALAKLPEQMQNELVSLQTHFERLQLEKLGMQALDRGHIIALPILVATNRLNGEEVIGKLKVQLDKLQDQPEKHAAWVGALGACQKIGIQGGDLYFAEGSSLFSTRLVIRIEPDGKRIIEAGSPFDTPPTYLKATTAETTVTSMLEGGVRKISP